MNNAETLARAKKADQILTACGIDHVRDFHELSTSQVDKLLTFANKDQYRKPKHANGSRGRYYYQRLVRDIDRWTNRLEKGIIYRIAAFKSE
jgi:protein-tyrosine-phosphatase